MSNHQQNRSWTIIDGPLFAERSGSISAPNQILLHGFTQTSQSWNRYINLVNPEQPIIRVDSPGHAGSSSVAADLTTSAHMVVEQCGFGDYVGYSMGARLALHIALLHPDSVRRLVLISGSPGLRTNAEQIERQRSDEQLAREIRQVGVSQFVSKWLSNPMFANLVSTEGEIKDRLRNSVDGLVSSLTMSGTGSQQSLWDRLSELSMPVLLIVGENDQKFRQINSEMKNLISSQTELVIIQNAGHAVHLEQPKQCVSVIANFLS
jgi:2-succinyl-6-hydroxy-2,4-cyclohexadiene-1-carboxylate synthase